MYIDVFIGRERERQGPMLLLSQDFKLRFTLYNRAASCQVHSFQPMMRTPHNSQPRLAMATTADCVLTSVPNDQRAL